MESKSKFDYRSPESVVMISAITDRNYAIWLQRTALYFHKTGDISVELLSPVTSPCSHLVVMVSLSLIFVPAACYGDHFLGWIANHPIVLASRKNTLLLCFHWVFLHECNIDMSRDASWGPLLGSSHPCALLSSLFSAIGHPSWIAHLKIFILFLAFVHINPISSVSLSWPAWLCPAGLYPPTTMAPPASCK